MMPRILLEAGKLDPAVKEKLLRALTEVSAQITGIDIAYFYASIHELPDEDIAVAGRSVAAIKADKLKKQ